MTEPVCTCGLDTSPDGMRFCIVCPKHDGVFVTLSPITVVVPKPLGTEIWDEQRDESLREEGRKEERAKLNITLRGGATVSGEYPNLIVTGLYFGELSEQAREEGRREVKAEVRALLFRNDGDLEADLRELVGEDEPS